MLWMKTDPRRWWYSPVIPRETYFPLACRQTLTGFLLALSTHLSRKRPADTFLDFVTNSSSIVIVFLSELSSALTESPGSKPVDAVHEYLESTPSSSLANVVDLRQQHGKLKSVAEDILRSFLDPKAYTCEPVRVFLREILAGVILEMTVTSCSRPQFINEWIIYSLEETGTEILHAIDAGVSGSTAKENVKDSRQVGGSEVNAGHTDSSDPTATQSQTTQQHKRTVSRAEDAMEEAMLEAKRLSELIAAEEAKKEQTPAESTYSEGSAEAVVTPTSSRDNLSAILNGSSEGLAVEEELATRSSSLSEGHHSFTTFDQIMSSQQPTALQASMPGNQPYTVPPLTLYNASVSIFDDSKPGEKGTIRSKPTAEFLLQIEPATSQHPGWMIARKYSDFETLHEVLRRISIVSGVTAFADKHGSVPAWKNRTKATLRSDLEHYLRDALSFQRLAESEGMKRFLEKDQGLARSSPSVNKGGFGFPSPAAFENMGKGMLDVLASAPKGAAGGGKAILGGVSGALGGVGSIGQKKQASRTSTGKGPTSANVSTSELVRIDSNGDASTGFVTGRSSQESPRASLNASREAIKPPPLPRRHTQNRLDYEDDHSPRAYEPTLLHQEPSTNKAQESFSNTSFQNGEFNLPPPPSEISDDYHFSQTSPRVSTSNDAEDSKIHNSKSTGTSPSMPLAEAEAEVGSQPESTRGDAVPPTKPKARNAPTPLTSQETSVAVELFFATVNELYALSSAWTLRLTLLNAAKSFLLRPGNPNLEAIRVLLQSTVIDANTSDEGIASHLSKLRENALPTEEELKAWPPPPSEEDKEHRRQKARKLLVEKGMPQALTSVMGAAASGEALGRVFDCLQVPEVARGLIFALILQGVRAVTQ